MPAIHRFPLRIAEVQRVEMPEGARVLTAQQRDFTHPDGRSIDLWALVDTSAPTTERVFRIIGTGQPADDAEDLSYISTVQLQHGALVFHVFEKIYLLRP
jgi:hypothetical protein